MADIHTIDQALRILSYGYSHPNKQVSSFNEFDTFYQTDDAQKSLQGNVSILHCTTSYPAPLESINLRAMRTIQEKFNLPIGYSDHSEGGLVSIAAVAAGATIIEKHFTLDRSAEGPDHKASMEPKEFKEMVSQIRQIEIALGQETKKPTENEINIQKVACKKIVAAKPIKAGTIITEDLITTKRTNGASSFTANQYWDLLGVKTQEEVINFYNG